MWLSPSLAGATCPPVLQPSCSLQLCALPPAKKDSGGLDLELYTGFSLPALMRQTWAFEGFLQVLGGLASQKSHSAASHIT